VKSSAKSHPHWTEAAAAAWKEYLCLRRDAEANPGTGRQRKAAGDDLLIGGTHDV